MARDRAAYPRQRARHAVSVPELHLLVRAHPRGRDGRGRPRARRHGDGTPRNRPAIWRMSGTMSACRLRADASRSPQATTIARAHLLQPILDDVPCVGGSDEQRGVFAESHLVSLIRAGRRAEARTALQRTYRAPAGDRGRASMGRNDLMRLSTRRSSPVRSAYPIT